FIFGILGLLIFIMKLENLGERIYGVFMIPKASDLQ
ncbi:hypothetical protein A5844_002404, partial [Enterococcus sp. 10A9_DIV0425]